MCRLATPTDRELPNYTDLDLPLFKLRLKFSENVLRIEVEKGYLSRAVSNFEMLKNI